MPARAAAIEPIGNLHMQSAVSAAAAAMLVMRLSAAPPAGALKASAEDEPAVARVTSDFELSLLPGVWLPRLDGESSLGSGDVKFADQLDLDSGESVFNLEMNLRFHDRHELALSGFEFSTESTEDFLGFEQFGSLVLRSGDAVRSTMEIMSVAAEYRAWIWRPTADAPGEAPSLDNMTGEGRYVGDLRFAPVIAARYAEVDQSIELVDAGAREDVDGGWFGLLVGLGGEFRWRPRSAAAPLEFLQLDAAVGAGPALGGDGGSMVQIRGGFTVQVTPNVGGLVGWRFFAVDAQDGDYDVAASIHGLFFAGSIRY
jgi:hypothetical protein